MSHTVIFKYLLVSLILYGSHLQVLACLSSHYRYYVYVINQLPPNTAPLIAHCYSGDTEFGNHTVTPNTDFHFTFCDNISSTLFSCHYWWGDKNKAFEVFNTDWPDRRPTHHFVWVAQSDGIYLSFNLPPSGLVKKHDWE
ncbi:hypothetical protein PHJA_000429500 [Phtheirospermum japonicum]|uniref:S-protein homolog n=1 Tax=Phtheirospermum japonicum TaxID=374723 RepID=A0A830BDJ2_9LAMI|nr:hypothetical protein PHJA_000429500 [Phtheirospermum japonicum]